MTSTTSVRLIEYALISSFRAQSRASVDDFHAFLLSLGCGSVAGTGDGDGRFWALVACLLSVQCRDSVALDVTRALMNRCAANVGEAASATDGAGDDAATSDVATGDATACAAARVAALGLEQLEEVVRRCNFYKTKAKNVRSAAQHAVRRGGRLPATYTPASSPMRILDER